MEVNNLNGLSAGDLTDRTADARKQIESQLIEAMMQPVILKAVSMAREGLKVD